MEKIPTLFMRDPEDRKHLLAKVTPGCEWVLEGKGIPTRKYDGTCCLIRAGKLYRRHEVKPGKVSPASFEAVHHDATTGKTVGWVPVGDGPEDQWHREAEDKLPDGTYELIGPKIQGNAEDVDVHVLVRHGHEELHDLPDSVDFENLRRWLLSHSVEGIVWHHPDGRMAKLKKRDFV